MSEEGSDSVKTPVEKQSWWRMILQKRPGLEKYPGGMARPKVEAAEQGDEECRQWMRAVGLWMPEFDLVKRRVRRHGPSVRSMSREQVEALAPAYAVAIISITDVDSPQAAIPNSRYIRQVLRLSFDDYSEVKEGLVNFDAEMAGRIFDFVAGHRPYVRAILVHCEMGISRSAAVAIALSKALDLPVSHRNRADIWPNRLVLKVMAEEAQRQGS